MLKKDSLSEDPLNCNTQDEKGKILISKNLEQEPIEEDSFALKDFERNSDSIDKSNDLFTQEKKQVMRNRFFKCPRLQ